MNGDLLRVAVFIIYLSANLEYFRKATKFFF